MTTAARRGTTTVTDRAVRRISERAADEALRGRAGARTTKSAASVRGRRAGVALGMTLPYPAPLAETVRSVQEHVSFRTRELSGLDVPPARIEVTALCPAATGGQAQAPGDGDTAAPGGGTAPTAAPPVHTPRRSWSGRRLPAAVVAAAAALLCGALGADLIRVRTAHRPASAWRVLAVHWLPGHGPGDAAVVAAGVLTALLGLWLAVLAATPGLRRRATVRTPAPGVVATVDRTAVESLVRDAVTAVPGVGPVRVRMRRRRVTVRAGLLFGEHAQARAAVTAAAGGALTSCALRRSPRLRVGLVQEAVWQPPAPDTGADTDTDTRTDGEKAGYGAPGPAPGGVVEGRS
ncbi:DUF6286 domain-containing protein [Streptomyces sp. NPDC059168]|uniref:DUF6286 domain-containing protein n=1 Tax=Streptomyces sp. NPDC059168 TaxID=3346753 RepID=UPI00367F3388